MHMTLLRDDENVLYSTSELEYQIFTDESGDHSKWIQGIDAFHDVASFYGVRFGKKGCT